MKPFEVISEAEEYRDRDRFAVIRATLRAPNGDEVGWTYTRQGDGVVVLASDGEGNIWVKREWRLNKKDFLWELPSGYVDMEKPTDEVVLEAANRELQEEVGMKGGSLRILRSYYSSNHSTNRWHVVLAIDLIPSKLPGDEHEYLEVKKLPIPEARKLILEDQVPTAQVLIAMNELSSIEL